MASNSTAISVLDTFSRKNDLGAVMKDFYKAIEEGNLVNIGQSMVSLGKLFTGLAAASQEAGLFNDSKLVGLANKLNPLADAANAGLALIDIGTKLSGGQSVTWGPVLTLVGTGADVASAVFLRVGLVPAAVAAKGVSVTAGTTSLFIGDKVFFSNSPTPTHIPTPQENLLAGRSPSGGVFGQYTDKGGKYSVVATRNADGTITEIVTPMIGAFADSRAATGAPTKFTYNSSGATIQIEYAGSISVVDPITGIGTLVKDNGASVVTILDPKNITNPTVVVSKLNDAGSIVETDIIYTVKAGDTVSEVAEKYGVSTESIYLNNPEISRSTSLIKINQNIVVNVANHNIGSTWTVGAGATGELISAASGITLSQLQAANPGINVANPPVGTVLNLPTVQNGLLNFTNNIDSNGGPVWNTGNVENSGPTGANDFVFSEGSYTGFFTGASNNGIHNVAGSIVTDGWMPGAEVFSSINFISDNALPSSGFYTGGAWSSYGINLGSNYNYGIDLGAATFNNFSFSAYDFLSIDPLVLDLNGDGVKLTDYDSAPVLFDIDHDANGSLEQTGWVSAQDGILVHDLDADGKIDNISETISEYYTGAIGIGSSAGRKKYSNGFTALKSLDSNNDNQFTAADATYAQLRVWQDANHDGKTDAGELKTLASLGITSISLNATLQSGLVNGGNEVLATGSFVQNGITKQAQAVNLLANPVGHTFSATATGARITSDNGQQSYVSHMATGEIIDFAVKGIRNGYGNNGNDTLIGDLNSNWLVGGQGSDTFNAGAGDDVLLIDANDQQGNIHAGAGLDIAQVVGDAGVVLNLTQAELEVAIGGRGDDILIGGGRSNVFISGGEGDDIIIGGAADDALSGEEGTDLIDGGAGDDLIRGHRGRDQLMGGDGNDLIEGGLDDDNLSGGTGNDLLKGEQGDDRIDGGDGYDVVKLAGSYADYRITQVNSTTFRVVDTKTGRDGADTLTNIEAVTFADIGNIKLNQPIVMAVDDSVSVISGVPSYIITKASLFDNDLNLNGGILQLKSFGDAVGGIVSQNASGDFVFTPNAGYAGVMSFTYGVQTSAGQFIAATLPNGQSAPLKATVTLKTPNLPTDPLFAEQRYLNDVKVVEVWKDYTGKGVRIGQFEPDMPFQTDTMVFDYRHPDLQANVDQSWLASGAAPTSFSSHATMVAGIMVAAKNGEGTIGVAYDAKLSGISLGSSTAAPDWSLLDQWQNYDIVNNSWGPVGNFAANYLYPENETIDESLANAATYGRHGLGTSIVFGAGNQRAAGQDANQMLSNGRFSIQVGSVNQVQDLGALLPALTPYSNRGASILVSAPGSNITTTARLLMNGEGSVFGGDTEAVNGTSFAAPVVSGVIALMLEANPNLGYRDIQEILALSATKVATDPSAPTDWVDNHATNWNGGGMHTSHDYGFGQVDARAAVRLAESWMRTSDGAEWLRQKHIG